ncbi:MAG TPA: endo alpha-1,4 polygalactosaminidase [Kineosporiaceae bacterium]
MTRRRRGTRWPAGALVAGSLLALLSGCSAPPPQPADPDLQTTAVPPSGAPGVRTTAGTSPRTSTAASASTPAGTAAPRRTTSPPRTGVPALTGPQHAVQPPPANGRFDYQIGGAYPPAATVDIVDRDHSDPPAPGRYGICYINAFQTQPGAQTSWPAPAVLRTASGELVEDPDWPGEYVLDTRTAGSRAAIMGVLQPWLQKCAAEGFRAVEPDNLDSWTRSDRLLTAADNVALATEFTQAAHALGLAVAQKNTAELAPMRARIGFDFAIAEECQPTRECDAFTAAYGTEVIEIEYPDNGGPAAFQAACAARGARISIIYRDRMVRAAGRSGYTYQDC